MRFPGCKNALKYVCSSALRELTVLPQVTFCCDNVQKSMFIALEVWKTLGIFFSHFVATLSITQFKIRREQLVKPIC